MRMPTALVVEMLEDLVDRAAELQKAVLAGDDEKAERIRGVIRDGMFEINSLLPPRDGDKGPRALKKKHPLKRN